MVRNQIITLHFFLTSLKTGTLCGRYGHPIPNSSPPPPPDHDSSPNNWAPYGNRVQFEAADFLFSRQQMSASSIDFQLKLWAATLAVHGDVPPFASHKDMYEKIDATCLGDAPWESFTLKYEGTRPDHDVPDWMMAQHEVWFRDPLTLVHNMLSNPDFKDEFDYAPFQEYDGPDNHQFQDFMSGNWAWKQCIGSVTCR